jgi:hypothetical protein
MRLHLLIDETADLRAQDFVLFAEIGGAALVLRCRMRLGHNLNS